MKIKIKAHYAWLALTSCLGSLSACDTSSGYDNSLSAEENPDPTVVDYPVAYIARPIPRDNDGAIIADNVFEPMLAPGGALAESVGSIIGTGPGRGK